MYVMLAMYLPCLEQLVRHVAVEGLGVRGLRLAQVAGVKLEEVDAPFKFMYGCMRVCMHGCMGVWVG